MSTEELLALPGIVIYWAETKAPLTHMERVQAYGARVLSVGPFTGALLEMDDGRKIIVAAAGSPGAPAVPQRRKTDRR
jgi:hypothetical protein